MTDQHGAPDKKSLRILFLVSRDIRHPANTGGDIGLWERAVYLAQQGHRVTVMASRFDGAPPEDTIDGIHVYRVGGLLSLWWRTFFFYMSRGRGLCDVVVVEGFGGSRIPRFTPLYVKEPIVTEWHQIHSALFAVQYPRVLVPALNLLERVTAFVHRNTIVMARTEEWRDAFPQIGFKLENIRVVPACITEEWLNAPPARARNRDPQFVWLGKFRRYKCPDHAIRAMGDVVDAVPRAHLIFAGFHDDRVYERYLKELTIKLGLQDAISFRFGITDAEKQGLIDGSRALILTSAVEGFGIVVLEANGRGVPVIASSGVPEGSVAEGRNGMRYKFGDQSSLAAAMIRIGSDDALHERLSSQSRLFAEKFEFSKVCSTYEAVLWETVGRNKHEVAGLGQVSETKR